MRPRTLVMRKLALFTFLLLYTGSVVGLTVERTATWVTEHRRVVEHSGSDRAPHLCESRKHSAHPLQTKLFEDGSVFVPTPDFFKSYTWIRPGSCGFTGFRSEESRVGK